MNTDDKFIRKVYLNIKERYSNQHNKTCWIWIDFFASKKGFDYFKQSYLSDIENIKKGTYGEYSCEQDEVDDISDYICDELNKSDFINDLIQSTRYNNC